MYNLPVISQVVPGAWVENTTGGDPTLELTIIAAARQLVDRGAVAVASNCGFLVRHQSAVAAELNVPVALSSLILLPALLSLSLLGREDRSFNLRFNALH
ncbi:hypothetical protein ACVWXO_000819 [Bradyrhizobium sp. LM2.7]